MLVSETSTCIGKVICKREDAGPNILI